MKLKFLVIFKMLIQIQSYILFDQGYNQQLSYDLGYACNNSDTSAINVTFSGTFEIPPQILIFPSTLSEVNAPLSNFTIDLIFITTNYFSVNASCKSTGPGRYYFNWYAINDYRIQTLQKPTENNCVDQSIYTHSHNLSQATQAIVILQSWGQNEEPMNFYLETYELTSTTVKIKLHNSNSNLINFGYQIVLGTSDAFQKSELIQTPGGNGTLISKTIPKLNKGTFFLSLAGFDWRVKVALRFIFSNTETTNNIQYNCHTFSGTYMNSVRFHELQFLEQTFFPIYVYSYRVTKKYERFISHPIKISIFELNSEYHDLGEYSVQVPINMITLTIQIELKFYQGEKLVGSFLKCNQCGSKNAYRINQNYLCGYNFIRYRLLLRQHQIDAQNLIISIGFSSVIIKQTFNQAVDDYYVVQLQFVDQNP